MRLSLYRRHFIATCLLASGVGISVGIHAATTPAAAPKPATILIVGDSLSAEYGLKRGSGWAALLDQRLKRSMPKW
jgi:acyl-CoA thioesterase I